MEPFHEPHEVMNCTTGKMESRDPTDTEIEQRQKDFYESWNRDIEVEKKSAKKEEILEALAGVLPNGFTVDDLKEALSV